MPLLLSVPCSTFQHENPSSSPCAADSKPPLMLPCASHYLSSCIGSNSQARVSNYQECCSCRIAGNPSLMNTNASWRAC